MIDNTLALNAYNRLNDSKISTNLAKLGANSIDKTKLKEQTNAFEAFMVKTILDISIKNENSLFPKDAGDKIYQSMYNDTMSRALSGGFGFSKLLFDFLTQRS